MQYTTRFSQVEDVILTDGNFTSEYKEIQLGLKVYFSSMKLWINKRCQLNTRELKCISFDDISRSNKDRLKRQIFPVGRLENSDRALVKIYRGNLNSHLIIQEIKENSFTFYSTLNTNEIPMDWEEEFCDIGTFNLKYSEYEIVYCIVKELAKNRLFEDIEEFEIDYNFYKKMFIGTEKEFLKCLIHPYKLDGYSAIPYDYRDIENYLDLQTHLFKIKNGLVTPPSTEQPTNTKEFDNTTLTHIINDDMINLFLINEQRLKAEGFITPENKWINGSGKNQTKTMKDLANLILLLQEKKYLKLKFDRKPLKESDYKKFFEARYDCNLKEQFNKAIKDRTNRLETSKTTFIYF